MDTGTVAIQGSAGACQRVQAHLQLHYATFTVLLAAAWAVILHTAQAVLATLGSGLRHQTEAARAHMLLLKQLSPSRLYRKRAAAAAGGQHQQQSCITGAAKAAAAATHDAGICAGRRRRSHSQAGDAQHTLQQQPQSQQADVAAVSTHLAAISSLTTRIPMQLQEHRGRLTIALDLDETLLCTYRIEQHPGQSDTLQLVPSNSAGLACAGNSSSSGMLSKLSSLSWPLLSFTRSSTASAGGTSMGSYRIRTSCDGLPGELGAAARAAAWMHYVPPAAQRSTRNSSSGNSAGSSAGSSVGSSMPTQSPAGPQQHAQAQHPGLHVLAVFLRPDCREFLAQLSSFAEVVLFTAAAPEYGAALADLLDPEGRLFRGRLYGDACTHVAGRRGVKDLQVC
jgi:hypothetical protein